jgi:hypothetical protein
MTDIVQVVMPTETLITVEVAAAETIVKVVQEGPQGPVGPSGDSTASPVRINQSTAASTWIFSHSLGRVPIVNVYLANGELIIVDVVASTSQITVTFPSPIAGFVVLF